MRHRRKGRVLGRSPSHQRALLRNLASALMLTEAESDPGDPGVARVRGRIVTTLAKAKEVRPLVEKCVTVARRGRAASARAEALGTTADRGSTAWKEWRGSSRWRDWARSMAPAVKARRRLVQLLGDKRAARVVFDVIAPRFAERPGGYTRILKLARPRLGDAGPRAILEFVAAQGGDRPRAPQVEAARR